jgi:hypothetical protein
MANTKSGDRHRTDTARSNRPFSSDQIANFPKNVLMGKIARSCKWLRIHHHVESFKR